MGQILIEENRSLVIDSKNVDEVRLAISRLKKNPTLQLISETMLEVYII